MFIIGHSHFHCNPRGDLIAMDKRIIRTAIILLLCMGLCVGAASALSSFWLEQAKKSIPSYYYGPWPGSPSGHGTVMVKNIPGVIRPGDEISLDIRGTVEEGQQFLVKIQNGRFMTGRGDFEFRFTDFILPGPLDDITTTVTDRPVSWLRMEYSEDGTIAGIESDAPDARGLITLSATYDAEDEEEFYDYIAVKGTSGSFQTTMNLEIKGTAGADLEDPEVTFTVDELSKGYFTMIVAIDGKELLRQRVYVV